MVFDQPLLRLLSRQISIAQWQYRQEADEACQIEKAVDLLTDYLQDCTKNGKKKIHLLGHGTGGVVALLCTRLHPEWVKSLTLFAVAEQPAVTWHAHYYVQRHLMPCSQTRVLARVADNLFRQRPYAAKQLIAALNQDLVQVPLLHSICHLESLPQGGVKVPLMVCGAENDSVVYPEALTAWSKWFKLGDRQQLCKDGGHFFHYFHAELLSRKIRSFWQFEAALSQCHQINLAPFE
jgi:surfactin synthase thioesterase subunit